MSLVDKIRKQKEEQNKPLNISLLIPPLRSVPKSKEVKSTAVFIPSTQTFDPEGLFSNEIFGLQGSPERTTNIAHIKLKAPVIHPQVYDSLRKAVKLYDNIMAGKAYAKFEKNNFVKSTEEDGETGYSFFVRHVNDLKITEIESLSRQILDKTLRKYPQRLIDIFPVSPAGLRDYVIDKEGKPSSDEVNDIYVAILGYTKLLPDSGNVTKSMDNVRFALQQKLLEYENYILKDVLFNFINKRWVTRKTFGGTKNVMTAYKSPSNDLDSPSRAKLTDTLIGLFQALKLSPEVAVHGVQTGILANVFTEGESISVVNKKTYERKILPWSGDVQEFYDVIFSTEGVERLINNYRYTGGNFAPLEYGNYYLAGIYEDFDKHETKVIFDKFDIPDDKVDLVRPVTLMDLLYRAVYDKAHGKPSVNTRHPVVDDGGIYLGNNYLKVTNRVTYMESLDEEGKTYKSYPIIESGLFTSVSPNAARLGPLFGDNDGDMLGTTSFNTEEAMAQVNDKLKRASNYINTKNKLHYSLTGGSLGLVLPYVSKAWNGDMIEKFEDLIAERLVDDTEDGKVPKGKIDVSTMLKMVSALQSLEDLGPYVSHAATPKNTQKPPGLAEYKKKLLKEYKGQLDDPVKQVEFVEKLQAYDEEWLKDDPTNGILMSGKLKKVSRTKMYLVQGSEPNFTDELANHFNPHSFSDGQHIYSKKEKATINSAIRYGSYARGMMTAASGVVAKTLMEVFGSYSIRKEDCGTKLTKTELIQTPKAYIGRYIVQGGKLLLIDHDNAESFKGKTVALRSPMYCKEDHTYFCRHCAGERMYRFKDSLTKAGSFLGATFMYSTFALLKGNAVVSVDIELDDLIQ